MDTKQTVYRGRTCTMRAFGRTFLAPLCLSMAALGPSQASAQEVSILAGDNPALPSSFSLNFMDFGSVSSANISLTDIELAVDADAGTARFVRYYQEVEPLVLPGNISTGNLVIEVVEGSSAGTYDDAQGRLATDELYIIHFDGDLSAFGLESPVFLPGASAGNLVVSARDGGSLDLDWVGEGELANPFDPLTPIRFSYTCTVNAAFMPTPVSAVRLSMIPQVSNLSLPSGLERSLTSKLFGAVDALNAGTDVAGVNLLRAFNRSLVALAGRFVDETVVDDLLSDSEAVVALILDSNTSSNSGLFAPGKVRISGR